MPWAYVVPKARGGSDRHGPVLRENEFLSAGNITHTPAYGNLIALGVLTAVQSRNVAQHTSPRRWRTAS